MWRKTLLMFCLMVAAPAAAQTHLANCQDMTRIHDQRILDCTQALETGNYGPAALSHAHFYRAVAYRAKKEWDRALQDIAEADRLTSNDPSHFALLGGILREIGQTDSAIEVLDQGIQRWRYNIGAYFERGESWVVKGDHERAWSDFDSAIGWRLGSSPFQRGDELYTKARAFNAPGMASAALGRRAEAEADFNEALRLDPYLVDAGPPLVTHDSPRPSR